MAPLGPGGLPSLPLPFGLPPGQHARLPPSLPPLSSPWQVNGTMVTNSSHLEVVKLIKCEWGPGGREHLGLAEGAEAAAGSRACGPRAQGPFGGRGGRHLAHSLSLSLRPPRKRGPTWRSPSWAPPLPRRGSRVPSRTGTRRGLLRSRPPAPHRPRPHRCLRRSTSRTQSPCRYWGGHPGAGRAAGGASGLTDGRPLTPRRTRKSRNTRRRFSGIC